MNGFQKFLCVVNRHEKNDFSGDSDDSNDYDNFDDCNNSDKVYEKFSDF